MIKFLQKAAAIAVMASACLFASNASASTNFTGGYAVGNWTTSSSGVGGSVNTSGAPLSVVLIEPDFGSGGWIEFTISALSSGIFSFDWAWGGTDSCCGRADVYNGTLSSLAPYGTDPTSGTYSAALLAGDTIGWRVTSSDGIFGSTVLTISNFSVGTVPLPATLPLLLAALGGMGLAARRRKAA